SIVRTLGPVATTSPQASRLPIWAVAGIRIPPVDLRSPSASRFTRMRSLSIFTGSLSARDDANVRESWASASTRSPDMGRSAGSAASSVTRSTVPVDTGIAATAASTGSGWSDHHAGRLHDRLRLRDRVVTEVEDRSRQHRVGPAFGD